MSERYFCPELLASEDLPGRLVLLQGDEAHHLAHVMRAQAGDRVVLFDGEGSECEASVAGVRKREVQLRVESLRMTDREAAINLTLAVALPKGDRQRWVVEKATELGVANLIPLNTQRSVVALKSGGTERLTRFVIEASKQCGRNRLMKIHPPVNWPEFLANADEHATRLVAHKCRTDFQVRSASWTDLEIRPTLPVIAAIGPEGGFSEEEVQAAGDAGWQAISLGPRILRVETAAAALAALVLLR